MAAVGNSSFERAFCLQTKNGGLCNVLCGFLRPFEIAPLAVVSKSCRNMTADKTSLRQREISKVSDIATILKLGDTVSADTGNAMIKNLMQRFPHLSKQKEQEILLHFTRIVATMGAKMAEFFTPKEAARIVEVYANPITLRTLNKLPLAMQSAMPILLEQQQELVRLIHNIEPEIAPDGAPEQALALPPAAQAPTAPSNGMNEEQNSAEIAIERATRL
jgi:hypothetical protein